MVFSALLPHRVGGIPFPPSSTSVPLFLRMMGDFFRTGTYTDNTPTSSTIALGCGVWGGHFCDVLLVKCI